MRRRGVLRSCPLSPRLHRVGSPKLSLQRVQSSSVSAETLSSTPLVFIGLSRGVRYDSINRVRDFRLLRSTKRISGFPKSHTPCANHSTPPSGLTFALRLQQYALVTRPDK